MYYTNSYILYVSLSAARSYSNGSDERISAKFCPIGNNAATITIENDVNNATQMRKINVFTKEGGLNSNLGWKFASTFDWPMNRTYILHTLKSDHLYGIKLISFDKSTSNIRDSVSGNVFIPAGGETTPYFPLDHLFCAYFYFKLSEVVSFMHISNCSGLCPWNSNSITASLKFSNFKSRRRWERNYKRCVGIDSTSAFTDPHVSTDAVLMFV